ncbi:unnamed protein product [Amoebophrya sp. A25]|nr:unnamed protein product [Amoebophrya sp. A25]|eukprot:GSA25T00001287001.1
MTLTCAEHQDNINIGLLLVAALSFMKKMMAEPLLEENASTLLSIRSAPARPERTISGDSISRSRLALGLGGGEGGDDEGADIIRKLRQRAGGFRAAPGAGGTRWSAQNRISAARRDARSTSRQAMSLGPPATGAARTGLQSLDFGADVGASSSSSADVRVDGEAPATNLDSQSIQQQQKQTKPSGGPHPSSSNNVNVYATTSQAPQTGQRTQRLSTSSSSTTTSQTGGLEHGINVLPPRQPSMLDRLYGVSPFWMYDYFAGEVLQPGSVLADEILRQHSAAEVARTSALELGVGTKQRGPSEDEGPSTSSRRSSCKALTPGRAVSQQLPRPEGSASPGGTPDAILEGPFLETSADEEEQALLESSTSAIIPHRIGYTKAVICVLKANIGPGVLYLPKACSRAGCAMFLLQVSLFGFVATYCILQLTKVRERYCQSQNCLLSYGALCERISGSKLGLWLVNLSICLCQFGLCVTYYIVTSNLLRQALFPSWTVLELFFLVFLVVTPLTWIRSVQKLAFTNLLADACIFVGLSVMFVLQGERLGHDHDHVASGGTVSDLDVLTERKDTSSHFDDIFMLFTNSLSPSTATSAPTETTSPSSTESILDYAANALVCLGTVCFAFEGICCVIPTFDAMKEPSEFPSVVKLALFVTSALFGFAGILGYLVFGDQTADIVLLNFTDSSEAIPVKLVQTLYAIAILLTYPFQMLPATKVIEGYFFGEQYVSNPPFYRKALKSLSRSCLCFVFLAIAYVFFNSFENLVSLIGSFCGVPLAFLYPILCSWWGRGSLSSRKISEDRGETGIAVDDRDQHMSHIHQKIQIASPSPLPPSGADLQTDSNELQNQRTTSPPNENQKHPITPPEAAALIIGVFTFIAVSVVNIAQLVEGK